MPIVNPCRLRSKGAYDGQEHNFSYKGFNLSFLIDFRTGGSIYSETASNLYTRGNNLWMIHYNLPGIDPESVAATNTNATGFENGTDQPPVMTFRRSMRTRILWERIMIIVRFT